MTNSWLSAISLKTALKLKSLIFAACKEIRLDPSETQHFTFSRKLDLAFGGVASKAFGALPPGFWL
jgi:hypothetical protein